jgi:hypothetical protein
MQQKGGMDQGVMVDELIHRRRLHLAVKKKAFAEIVGDDEFHVLEGRDFRKNHFFNAMHQGAGRGKIFGV